VPGSPKSTIRASERAVAELTRRLESACRARGIPVTVQRRVILEALARFGGHPTVDQLYQDVRKRLPTLSRATVYRVLDTLIELGLVRRISTRDAVARFDTNLSRHHHLVCDSCGRVEDVEEGLLPLGELARVDEILGFRISEVSVELRGLCQRCRQAGSDEGRRAEHP